MVDNNYQMNVLKDDIALEKFIDDLVNARQDLWVNPENRDKFKKALMEQLKDEINMHFINQLTESDQKLLDQMLNRNVGNEEINKFFIDRISDHTAHLAIIFQRFKEMIMIGKK